MTDTVNMSVPVKRITQEDFQNLTLEDVNYSGILFVFEPEYANIVSAKLLNDWLLGKSWRVEQVKTDHMFFIENCDIQTIDSLSQLFGYLYDKDTIKKIHVLGDPNNIF